jgi:predicted kinase
MHELERLPAGFYPKESSARVYAVLDEKAQIVLAAGRSVTLDAVYASEEDSRGIETVATTLGVTFEGIWLTADRETLIARVGARRNDASDATPDVVAAQLQYEMGTMSPAWRLIEAGGTADVTLHPAASQLGLKP